MATNTSLLSRLHSLFGRAPTHPLLERSNQHFAQLDQNRSLESFDFVVIDTELTGMDHARDEIVSIGAVRIRNLAIEPTTAFHTLVHPEGAMPKKSTLVPWITPGEVIGAPRLNEVLPHLIEYCEGSLIVGHHVGLDMSFINRSLREFFGGNLRTPCLDTMRLAKMYDEELWVNYYDQFNLNVSYNLRELALRYGLPCFPEHDALQDALQTAYLFLFLVKKLRRGSIKTLKDLYMAGRSWKWYF
jgi:DNA polymerase III subunit epsilon